MEPLKSLGRPPFANYDIVVYFGGGLFALPFLYRYFVHPAEIPLPAFVINNNEQVTLEVVRGLTILVAVYVLGHIIAFLSSLMIEKTVDRFLGKMSTAIIVSMRTTKANRNSDLKKMFAERLKRTRSDNAMLSAVVRAIFHAPNFLHYWILYKSGIFGYLDTRIPPEAFHLAKTKYTRIVIPGGSVETDTQWYKSLEYFVINRCAGAVPRMYNYLVIAGLFRSSSLIFLACSWGVIVFYFLNYMQAGARELGLAEHKPSWRAALFEWMLLASLSVFALVAYLKFQRRYAEEAIMALAFDK